MFPQIIIKHDIGNTIEIPNQLDSSVFTYLGNNYALGVTALLAENPVGFSSGNILLQISSLGSQHCEIVNSASHTATTFTTDATLQPHSRGDIVQQINYDQVVIAKNGSALATVEFQVTQQSTIYKDLTGTTSDTYTVQWKNSITADVSTVSTAISVLTYPTKSVANIIYPVLRAMGISENDPKINTTFCLSAVDDARKFVEAKLYGIRHAWNQEFEHPIQMLAGSNYVDLPDNIDFNETDRSVLAARLLIDNILTPYNLKYIDKRTYNQVAFSVMGGTTTLVEAIGSVTVELDSVGDFPDSSSGVAYIATTDFDQDIEEIAYTGIDLVNNQLTGVTGITRSIPIGTRVWSRPTISQPIYYTIFENRLYFDRIIPDSMQGQNVYIDYYKKTTAVENLYQELPEHYSEIYKCYLRYAIKYRKDLSLESNDPDLKKFESLVDALFDNLYTGQDTTIITS